MCLWSAKHEHSWWVRPFVATTIPECVPPDSVIALLYAPSTYLRLIVHYFKFHPPLQISSQHSHYVLSADSDAPHLLCFHPSRSVVLRSVVLRSLTFSWDPGLLMTFLRFVSLSEPTCGWLSRISSWCQRHLTRTCAFALPPSLRKYSCDVTRRDDIKKRLHAREWQRETSATSSKGSWPCLKHWCPVGSAGSRAWGSQIVAACSHVHLLLRSYVIFV